jgi:hypothetical protein
MENDDDDPFAQLAKDQIVSPVRARMRANATRAERRAAKQQSDKEILHRQWRDWHDKQLKKLLTGRYRKAANSLANYLETLSMEDGDALVDFVERGPWRESDPDTRYTILSLIDHRIIYLREAHGLAPFDDSIPFSDEEPTAFEIIRGLVGDDNC